MEDRIDKLKWKLHRMALMGHHTLWEREVGKALKMKRIYMLR